MTSTNDQNDHTILKTDERGRVRTPVERREALLDEFERSALSGMKFAQLAGIKYATFANWIQKRRTVRKMNGGPAGETGGMQSPPVARTAPVRLFEAFAQIGAATGADSLLIELPGGARMRVDSPGQARLAAEMLRLISNAEVHPC